VLEAGRFVTALVTGLPWFAFLYLASAAVTPMNFRRRADERGWVRGVESKIRYAPAVKTRGDSAG
jgi:hypothetical protein